MNWQEYSNRELLGKYAALCMEQQEEYVKEKQDFNKQRENDAKVAAVKREILSRMGRTEKFKVNVVETYSRTVEVEAKDRDNAIEIIDEKISNGEIDLPRDNGEYGYTRELFVEKNNI